MVDVAYGLKQQHYSITLAAETYIHIKSPISKSPPVNNTCNIFIHMIRTYINSMHNSIIKAVRATILKDLHSVKDFKF